ERGLRRARGRCGSRGGDAGQQDRRRDCDRRRAQDRREGGACAAARPQGGRAGEDRRQVTRPLPTCGSYVFTRIGQGGSCVITGERNARDPGSSVVALKTLDSLTAFAGTKGRGNDGESFAF